MSPEVKALAAEVHKLAQERIADTTSAFCAMHRIEPKVEAEVHKLVHATFEAGLKVAHSLVTMGRDE